MYHAWWPSSGDPFYQHNLAENTGRINYYGLPWVPFEITDGVLDIDFPPSQFLFQAAYDERKAVPCTVELELTGLYRPETRALSLTVSASNTGFLPAGDYRLHVALTESGIFFDAPNGVDYHEYTMRDMIPDEVGIAMTFAGEFPQVDSFQAGVTVNPTYEQDNCELIFFVQNHDTEEVLQAGSVDLMALADLTATGQAPVAFELGPNYPNPFNPATTLPVALAAAGQARVSVLDTSGRLLRTLHSGELAAGAHEFSWDGRDAAGRPLGSGVYLYRVEASGDSRTGKMLLLK